MRKGVRILLVIAVGLFLIASTGYAAGQPKYGGKLTIGQDVDAVACDPCKTTAFASWNYYEHVYDSLLKFDEEANLKPNLATSWDTPDPKTVIFHLQKGVKFHNGEEFTAEDVKATFDRLLNPKSGCWQAKTFRLLDNVAVVDRFTVRFNLKEPFAPLLGYLGNCRYSAIMCKSVIEKEDPNKVMVGTGPFQLIEFRANDRMRLKKNPTYREKGLPYLDEMEIRLIKDASSRLAAIRSRSVDYTWIIEPQLVQILLKEKKVQSGMAPYTGKLQIYFNCSKPPFDNVKVRQAMSLATDRGEIIRVTIMGKAALSGAIPPAGGDFALPVEKLSFYEYNPDRAKKLLAEAGYPNGLKAQMKVSAAHPIDQYAAQVLQRQWKKVGVDINIVQQEWGTHLKDGNKRNHQIWVVARIWTPDPDEYIRYGIDFNRRAAFKTPEMDEMVKKGATTLDHNGRVKIYHEIQKYVAEQAPILYIYARPQRFEFWRDYVKGYTPTPPCSRFTVKRVWLDK